MLVKCMKMCFLELAVNKISDCYLKLPQERTPICQIFHGSKMKEKIVNFKNIFKSCCRKNELGQNN